MQTLKSLGPKSTVVICKFCTNLASIRSIIQNVCICQRCGIDSCRNLAKHLFARIARILFFVAFNSTSKITGKSKCNSIDVVAGTITFLRFLRQYMYSTGGWSHVDPHYRSSLIWHWNWHCPDFCAGRRDSQTRYKSWSLQLVNAIKVIDMILGSSYRSISWLIRRRIFSLTDVDLCFADADVFSSIVPEERAFDIIKRMSLSHWRIFSLLRQL